jgi:hypothetical protein
MLSLHMHAAVFAHTLVPASYGARTAPFAMHVRVHAMMRLNLRLFRFPRLSLAPPFLDACTRLATASSGCVRWVPLQHVQHQIYFYNIQLKYLQH